MRNIFVFGSNLAGRHGAGAALHARQMHGAIYGQSVGLQGDSYAIPTKDERLVPLPLLVINRHITEFVIFAGQHQDWVFNVTAIGTGLAGFRDAQIAPLFRCAPSNCEMPKQWQIYLPEKK